MAFAMGEIFMAIPHRRAEPSGGLCVVLPYLSAKTSHGNAMGGLFCCPLRIRKWN